MTSTVERCPVCEHKDRAAIEEAIRNKAGSYADIGHRFRKNGFLLAPDISGHIVHAGLVYAGHASPIGRAIPRPQGGRLCICCEHPNRKEIEKATVLKSLTYVQIEGRYAVKMDSVKRHMANHVTEEQRKEILLAAKRERVAEVDTELNADKVDITSGLGRVIKELDAILQRAKEAGDDNLALVALRDTRGCLMDLAQILGKIKEHHTIELRISESPQFIALREILGDVFRVYPGAGQMFLSRTQHLRLDGPPAS